MYLDTLPQLEIISILIFILQSSFKSKKFVHTVFEEEPTLTEVSWLIFGGLYLNFTSVSNSNRSKDLNFFPKITMIGRAAVGRPEA